MRYTVIEEFNDELNIAQKDGKPFITDELEEAEDLLSQLQGGYVVPLGNVINLAKAAVNDKLNMDDIQYEMRKILGVSLIDKSRKQ